MFACFFGWIVTITWFVSFPVLGVAGVDALFGLEAMALFVRVVVFFVCLLVGFPYSLVCFLGCGGLLVLVGCL